MAYAEFFPSLGAITSGQNQTWSKLSEDGAVISTAGANRFANEVTASDSCRCRCETDLASPDHSAAAYLRYLDLTSEPSGALSVRNSASDGNCYYAGYWAGSAVGYVYLRKLTGAHTTLTSNNDPGPPSAGVDYRVELIVKTIGSSAFLTVKIDGVTYINAHEDNSSPFLTQVRCGLLVHGPSVEQTTWRSFVAQEVGTVLAPTGLTASPGSGTTVDLAWTNKRVDLPTRIYRRRKPGT